VEPSDVLEAATLALGHRMPYDPFVSGPQLDALALQRELEGFLEMESSEKKKQMKT
jgi:hypothetical protein